MAPMKDAGILHFLLLGLLLSSAPVSGQANNTTIATTSPPAVPGLSPATTVTLTVASTSMSSTSTISSGNGTAATTRNPVTPAPGTIQPSSSPGSSSMMSAATTSTQPNVSTTSGGTNSSSTMTLSANSTNGMNGTMMPNGTSMNVISCPSFNCNYSNCYTMYTSQNHTLCTPGDCCQLFKSMGMWYTAGCTSSCAGSCVNATQTNCSVSCCNSTGCLNNTFASMMATTAAPTTTTSQSTPAATTTTTTTVSNGKKCPKGTCTGETCYTSFRTPTLEICSSSQPHCQLKKETVNSATTWTAGCTNCTGQTPCKTSTQPPCHLECCEATVTSCLMLNGTLNLPSSSTRGPQLHTQLIPSLFCLLAIFLLM